MSLSSKSFIRITLLLTLIPVSKSYREHDNYIKGFDGKNNDPVMTNIKVHSCGYSLDG
jgi:hypothetical protein